MSILSKSFIIAHTSLPPLNRVHVKRLATSRESRAPFGGIQFIRPEQESLFMTSEDTKFETPKLRFSSGRNPHYEVSRHFHDLKETMKALFNFTRPYALLGTCMAVVSHSLSTLQSFGDISPRCLVGVVQVSIACGLAQIVASGINQIYDVEIDRINKPHLPVASGAMSMQFATTIVTASLIGSLGLTIMFRSVPLFSGILMYNLLYCIYSIELPFMRWKSNQFLAMLTIVMGRGLLLPFITFFHIQHTFGRPIVLTKSILVASCVCALFSVVISLSKDLPDVEGDKKAGLDLLTVKLGQKPVFTICASVLMATYGLAIGIGLSSTFLYSRIITVLSHVCLAGITVRRTLLVDIFCSKSTQAFYGFIWRLLYVEYALLPFIR